MILSMSKVRILGPRARLDDTLRVLQDLGLVHLAGPTPRAPFERVRLAPRDARRRRQLEAILADLELLRQALPAGAAAGGGRPSPASASDLARWARLARRLRRRAEALRRRSIALDEERRLIEKYRQSFTLFESLLRAAASWPNGVAYHLVLRGRDAGSLERLRAALAASIGDAFELRVRSLPGGEQAVLLLVAADASPRVGRILEEAGVQEIPVPAGYGGKTLSETLPRMIERAARIPAEEEAIRRELDAIVREHGTELGRARAAIRDRIVVLEALPMLGVTARAFVIEGWLPSHERPRLRETLARGLGETILVEEVSRESWATTDVPVVLSNPRLFRPFEAIVRTLPLPRYGNIDPTPFVGVFFPMFFGLMLGDVGYGIVLAAVGLWIHARSAPRSPWRDVAEISGPCAAFSILFGFVYGEFIGDLGREWFGLHGVFEREEALVPFLVLAVSIGLVHVLLGLGLGVLSSFRQHPRQALGRGLEALMIVVIVLVLLAAVEVLPAAFFTPSVVALLVAFPVLVAVEGLLAPLELLSMLGSILSYARIMAIGTASVMLAIVANEMHGALGSAAVGALFALLFHLVNFALGVFGPAIHALRLHYVEFFGKFYSPGGTPFRPFAHWKEAPNPGS